MSKRTIVSSLLPLASMFMPFVVLAAAPSDVVTPIVNNVIEVSRLLITLMMILSVVVLGWGIIKLIVAAGNPEAVKKAKGVIIWGVIGIAVFVSLFGIVQFIRTYFGITETETIKGPTVQ